MPDRLTDLVIGLQRLAENARIRGDDLRYTQQHETDEHLAWLDDLLGMVAKVHTALISERKKFTPAERERVQQIPSQNDVPRVQGPLPQHLKRAGGDREST